MYFKVYGPISTRTIIENEIFGYSAEQNLIQKASQNWLNTKEKIVVVLEGPNGFGKSAFRAYFLRFMSKKEDVLW